MLNSVGRRITARKVRVDAAEEQFLKPNPVHADNGDEARYPNKIGSSTKGLKHDSRTGEVIPTAYAALLAALRGGRSTDFDALAANGALGCADPTRQRRFVTPQTLFRDVYAGCTTGPYISQFLLQPVHFGAQRIDTTILTNQPGVDFNTDFANWLSVIDGCQPLPSPAIAAGIRVYAHNGRAVAQYVHTDFLYQAYFVAAVNLLGGAGTVYLGDAGNPYGQVIDNTGTGLPLPVGRSGSPADIGFGTFGAPAIATLVCEVATRALKHQFLPQAFPEGSPLHTAYGSGHATVAGACVTGLKWFFDESEIIRDPVVPDPVDPTKLVPYVAPRGAAPLTVGGELNKLASNISQARNIAGVHWRTDATEANRLGEEVAIAMLEEFGGLFNEPYGG
jgi:hypothetical protein